MCYNKQIMSVFCNLNEVMYQLMVKQKGGIYLKVFRKNLQEKLKEYVGHTPIQVAAGAILGILIAFILDPMFI